MMGQPNVVLGGVKQIGESLNFAEGLPGISTHEKESTLKRSAEDFKRLAGLHGGSPMR